MKTIRKSRNFIPDQITRLWLIHFNSRNIRTVNQNVEDYLQLILIRLSYHLILKLINYYATTPTLTGCNSRKLTLILLSHNVL